MKSKSSRWAVLWKQEDWWAVWLGLGLVIVALAAFWGGSTIKAWAVTPGRWAQFSEVRTNFRQHGLGYLAVFAVFGAVFAVSMRIMGHRLAYFIPGFALLFLGSLIIFYLAGWKVMQDYNVEAPLLALLVGLVISNLFRMPDWFKAALRTEYYVKTGIVLLGATLPLTLIYSAGPVAFVQATVVSITTWLAIYWAATRLFHLEPQFGAVLGAGGAVCGVSASIAVGGAVKASKDQVSISIAVVTVWAIVMILILTLALKQLTPEPISPGVAGAWIGTSEFADAAGFAVAAELASRFGDAPIRSFTLMKVIGRDIWIGIWCLVLSVVSVVLWEKSSKEKGDRVRAGVIWERFPKFVLGFLAASVVMSWVSGRAPADHVGKAAMDGKRQGAPYSADFSNYQAPAALANRLHVDFKSRALTFDGRMTREDLKTLSEAAPTPEQQWVLAELQRSADWYESVLTPKVISPIKSLRSWAFVLCFLCIGLSTRFADLMTFGVKPFWAFTVGVLVNVPLGYILSTAVFGDFWSNI